MERKLTAFDDYFIHQLDEPLVKVARPGKWVDRGNFYVHDLEGKFYVATGMGSWANAEVMDGFASFVANDIQQNIRLSRHLADGDRSNMRVGPLSYQITKPLVGWQIDLAPNETGFSFSFAFEGRGAPLMQELRVANPAQGVPAATQSHFDAFGRCHGWAVINGEKIEGDFLCVRDRSWGSRDQDLPKLSIHLWIQAQMPGYCVSISQQEKREGGMHYSEGYVQYDTGVLVPIVDLRHRLVFDGVAPEHKSAAFRITLANGKVLQFETERCQRGWFLVGGGYGGWYGQPHGDYVLEHERWDISKVTVDDTTSLPPFTTKGYDQLATFSANGEAGAGIIEVALPRNPAHVYVPTF